VNRHFADPDDSMRRCLGTSEYLHHKNGGREWQPKGAPEEVVIHDFVDEQLGKVIPYGVVDLSLNEGWVSVGIDHDTAQFAVQAIGRWWQTMGSKRYPRARALLITADGGGSNGSRCRLWKVALKDLATCLGFTVHVRHFPPGTGKCCTEKRWVTAGAGEFSTSSVGSQTSRTSWSPSPAWTEPGTMIRGGASMIRG
jgi:hypothetical protein